MKIKYIWHDQPDVQKFYDTRISLVNSRGFLNMMGSFPNQEDWDKKELANFERDKQRGKILSYEIVEGV